MKKGEDKRGHGIKGDQRGQVITDNFINFLYFSAKRASNNGNVKREGKKTPLRVTSPLRHKEVSTRRRVRCL
jgi:hypothetical protein